LGSLSVSADDLIYIADDAVGVRVLDADGNVLHTITNSDITNFDDVEVADDGTLWIVDSFESKIYHLDAQGNMLGSFGEQGLEPGQFSEFSPAQVELGTDGNLYFFNSRKEDEHSIDGLVVVYTQDGTFVREFPADPNPNDGRDLFGFAFMAVGPDGTIYAGDFYTPGVRAFAQDGTVTNSGIGTQMLSMGIQQVAVGPVGSIYVAPIMERTIYKFDPNGNLLTQYTLPIDFLSGMGVLSDGSVIVAGASSTQDASVVLRLNAQ
jgi:streptogramin lyase